MAEERTEPIVEEDLDRGFTCGVPALDDFFRRHAFGNHRRGLGRTFVLHGIPPGQPSILGFYTLSMAVIEGRTVPRELRHGLPRYPLPVALIGRLAVHQDVHGQGIGEFLLGDALRRILSGAETVGCFGVIVDAKDEGARRFYEHYGFVDLDERGPYPRRMFIALETVRPATTRA